MSVALRQQENQYVLSAPSIGSRRCVQEGNAACNPVGVTAAEAMILAWAILRRKREVTPMSKQITYGDDSRPSILRGVNRFTEAVTALSLLDAVTPRP
jgi:hypothetical protein